MVKLQNPNPNYKTQITKLNVNKNTMIKNVKLGERNPKIETAFLITKILKMI